MRVEGYCPMGCGQTLVIDEHTRHVVCSYLRCPAPAKVDELLADSETEHIVQLGAEDEGFTVLHPLRERPDEVLECDLFRWIKEQGGPPRAPGRYRVRHQPGVPPPRAWTFELLLSSEDYCDECGDDHAEYREQFDRALCGRCFTDACDEVDQDRAEHAQRDEGERR